MYFEDNIHRRLLVISYQDLNHKHTFCLQSGVTRDTSLFTITPLGILECATPLPVPIPSWTLTERQAASSDTGNGYDWIVSNTFNAHSGTRVTEVQSKIHPITSKCLIQSAEDMWHFKLEDRGKRKTRCWIGTEQANSRTAESLSVSVGFSSSQNHGLTHSRHKKENLSHLSILDRGVILTSASLCRKLTYCVQGWR